MIRDPRDMLVSLSFFFAKNAKEGVWWKHFPELSPKERILQLIESDNSSLDLLREWFQCPFAYKVRYEDLISDGEEQLERIIRYLGYDYGRNVIASYYQKHSFEVVSGRKPGVEDTKSTYRKGVAEDWKNHFDADCLKAFKYYGDGKLQELLVLLGYERDANW